ncbi:MAG: GNAT family N-acetyltransferase [Bacteroidota bacterium]
MHLEILASKAIDPPSWDAFIEAAPEGGLFSLYAYLNVLRSDWQAAIVKEGEKWQAVMPFVREKKLGFSRVGQPAFTQYWGPVLAPRFAERSAYKHYSWKRQVLETMLPAWEKDDLFSMNYSPAFDYPMPFFEAGYELHTRYTYQVDLSLGKEANWAAMDSAQRRKIRKATQNPQAIEHSFGASDLLKLYEAQAAHGNDILSVAPEGKRIISELLQLLPAKLKTYLRAYRQERQIVAAACFAEFRDHCYYLFGTYDPQSSQGGEIAALMWDVMQTTSCRIFDFEGSMIPSIARFFRRMGGQPKPYLQVRKNALPLPIRWINELRS